jgi:hypothetical protein
MRSPACHAVIFPPLLNVMPISSALIIRIPINSNVQFN